MNGLTLVVFAYNFPHKKTQDMLMRLYLEGYQVSYVLASDWVDLGIPPSSIRTKIRHEGLVEPRVVAQRIGAKYVVVPHNSDASIGLLERLHPDLGVIAGARILSKRVIDCFRLGIVNFHPGLIPESRGLDAMLWSIYRDIPLGVTAHLIDHRVDAGAILIRRMISIYRDDTFLDLSERLHDTQLDMVRPAIEAALCQEAEPLGSSVFPYNRKMPPELERVVVEKFPEYVRRFGVSHDSSGSMKRGTECEYSLRKVPTEARIRQPLGPEGVRGAQPPVEGFAVPANDWKCGGSEGRSVRGADGTSR